MRDKTAKRQDKTLADLADLLWEIEQFVSSIPDEGHFYASRANQFASEGLISRLGEVINRLPTQFKDQRPGVPWRQIRSARNLVAHDYEHIKHRILWESLRNDVPQIKAALSADLPPPRPILSLDFSAQVNPNGFKRKNGIGSNQYRKRPPKAEIKKH